MIFYSEKNPWSFHFQPQPSNNKDHWKREWNNIAKRKLFGVDCTRTNTKQNNIRQGLEGDWASKALKAVFLWGITRGIHRATSQLETSQYRAVKNNACKALYAPLRGR